MRPDFLCWLFLGTACCGAANAADPPARPYSQQSGSATVSGLNQNYDAASYPLTPSLLSLLNAQFPPPPFESRNGGIWRGPQRLSYDEVLGALATALPAWRPSLDSANDVRDARTLVGLNTGPFSGWLQLLVPEQRRNIAAIALSDVVPQTTLPPQNPTTSPHPDSPAGPHASGAPDPRRTTAYFSGPISVTTSQNGNRTSTNYERSVFSGVIVYSQFDPAVGQVRTFILTRRSEGNDVLLTRGTQVFLPDPGSAATTTSVTLGQGLRVDSARGLTAYSIHGVIQSNDSSLALVEVRTGTTVYPASPLAPLAYNPNGNTLAVTGFRELTRSRDEFRSHPQQISWDEENSRYVGTAPGGNPPPNGGMAGGALVDARNRIVGLLRSVSTAGPTTGQAFYSTQQDLGDLLALVGLTYPEQGGRLQIPNYDGINRRLRAPTNPVDTSPNTSPSNRVAEDRVVRDTNAVQALAAEPTMGCGSRRDGEEGQGPGCSSSANAADGSRQTRDLGGPEVWLAAIVLARLVRRKRNHAMI